MDVENTVGEDNTSKPQPGPKSPGCCVRVRAWTDEDPFGLSQVNQLRRYAHMKLSGAGGTGHASLEINIPCDEVGKALIEKYIIGTDIPYVITKKRTVASEDSNKAVFEEELYSVYFSFYPEEDNTHSYSDIAEDQENARKATAFIWDNVWYERLVDEQSEYNRTYTGALHGYAEKHDDDLHRATVAVVNKLYRTVINENTPIIGETSFTRGPKIIVHVRDDVKLFSKDEEENKRHKEEKKIIEKQHQLSKRLDIEESKIEKIKKLLLDMQDIKKSGKHNEKDIVDELFRRAYELGDELKLGQTYKETVKSTHLNLSAEAKILNQGFMSLAHLVKGQLDAIQKNYKDGVAEWNEIEKMLDKKEEEKTAAEKLEEKRSLDNYVEGTRPTAEVDLPIKWQEEEMGLDVEEMFKMMREIHDNKIKFDIQKFNCSESSLKILEAGAQEAFKVIFQNRGALSIFPVIIENFLPNFEQSNYLPNFTKPYFTPFQPYVEKFRVVTDYLRMATPYMVAQAAVAYIAQLEKARLIKKFTKAGLEDVLIANTDMSGFLDFYFENKDLYDKLDKAVFDYLIQSDKTIADRYDRYKSYKAKKMTEKDVVIHAPENPQEGVNQFFQKLEEGKDPFLDSVTRVGWLKRERVRPVTATEEKVEVEIPEKGKMELTQAMLYMSKVGQENIHKKIKEKEKAKAKEKEKSKKREKEKKKNKMAVEEEKDTRKIPEKRKDRGEPETTEEPDNRQTKKHKK